MILESDCPHCSQKVSHEAEETDLECPTCSKVFQVQKKSHTIPESAKVHPIPDRNNEVPPIVQRRYARKRILKELRQNSCYPALRVINGLGFAIVAGVGIGSLFTRELMAYAIAPVLVGVALIIFELSSIALDIADAQIERVRSGDYDQA